MRQPLHRSLSTDFTVRNKPERDEAQVVDQVLGVDDALREIVEVLGDRQMLQHRLRRRPDEGRRSS